MEFDAYNLKQVLPNINFSDILLFLQTEIPPSETDFKSVYALAHFLSYEKSLENENEKMKDILPSDVFCIKQIFKMVEDKEIEMLLRTLGPIPDRKQIAVKLLLAQHWPVSKNKSENSKTNEIGSRKTANFNSISYANNMLDNSGNVSEPPSKIKRKDDSWGKERNCNSKLPDVFSFTRQINQPSTSNGTNYNRSTVDAIPGPSTSSNGNNNLVINNSHFSFKIDNSKYNNHTPFSLRSTSVSDPKEMLQSIEAPVLNCNSSCSRSFYIPQRNYDIPNTSINGSNNTASRSSGPTVSKPLNLKITPKDTPSIHSNGAGPSGTYLQTLFTGMGGDLAAYVDPPDALPSNQLDIDNGINYKPNLLNHVNENVNNNEETSSEETSFDETSSDETIIQSLDDIDKLNDDVMIIDGEPPEVIVDEKLVYKLMEMFPDASPDYIRNLCNKKTWSEMTFNEIASTILDSNGNHPKRPQREPSPEKEINMNEQLETIKALLPDADPTYIESVLDSAAGDQEIIRGFIEKALEKRDYPTMRDYLRKQQISAQQKQYTTEFDISRFMELFPDPEAIFENPNRKTTVLTDVDTYYVKWFMRNKYNQLYVKDVDSIVDTEAPKNVYSVFKAMDDYAKHGRRIKRSKRVSNVSLDSQNIPLLQELAYFKNKEDILANIASKKIQEEQERNNAKELGLLQECGCCYDNEVMPKDILTCTGGCRFCRNCIKRGVEVAFAEGKTKYVCFNSDCDVEFSVQVLQDVLTPKLFSKLAQKKALAEIKSAGLDDLEMCPFCDFASIPVPGDKLFRCLNPDCMKESCRECKEPSHVPYRCDEVEKDESVKARTYIENKMTEALIRQCWRCKANFIKEDGCNKMTCTCGAMMCYICRQPVTDYKHFNGQGGDRFDLCPLYSDSSSSERTVIEAARAAKKEVDISQLKNDPSADMENDFKHKVKKDQNRHNVHVVMQAMRNFHARNHNEEIATRRLLAVELARSMRDPRNK